MSAGLSRALLLATLGALPAAGAQDPAPATEPAPVQPAPAPVEQPAVKQFGLAPLPIEAAPTSEQPEVARVGRGAPELLVWFGPERPGPSELAWRRSILASLKANLLAGEGSLHVLIALGPPSSDPSRDPATLPEFERDFPDLTGGPATALPERDDSRFLASYLVEHPELTGILRLARPQQRLAWSVTEGGVTNLQPRREPRATGVRELPARWGSLADQTASERSNYFLYHTVGLGLEERVLGLADLRDQGRWVRPDGSSEAEAWSWSEQVVLAAMDQAPVGAELLRISRSLLDAPGAAGKLRETLRSAAGLELALTAAPEHLGGDLWQVDLSLDAPDLQTLRIDPERTYPRASFRLQLSWGGTVDTAEFPSLARLAWSGPDSDAEFLLLEPRGERFGFPGDGLPEGARLRLFVQAPDAAAVGRELVLRIDAGRDGDALLPIPLAGPEPAPEPAEAEATPSS